MAEETLTTDKRLDLLREEIAALRVEIGNANAAEMIDLLREEIAALRVEGMERKRA